MFSSMAVQNAAKFMSAYEWWAGARRQHACAERAGGEAAQPAGLGARASERNWSNCSLIPSRLRNSLTHAAAGWQI